MENSTTQHISDLVSMFPHLHPTQIQSVVQNHDGDQVKAAETLLLITELLGSTGLEDQRDRPQSTDSIPVSQTTSLRSEDDPIQPTNVSSSNMSRPLRLLSLDGGGYRGLALLYQLRHVMRNIPGISFSEKLYPHQYFDLIGGTSTGGLVALMLGRLGMDIETAIEKYKELGPAVFGTDQGAFLGIVLQGAQFDAKPFEDALVDWVENQPVMDPDVGRHSRCFVTTVPAQLASVMTPTIIRSYPDPPQSAVSSHRWLIREAARATSAAPTYFPPLNLGNGYTFKDAGAFGFNNPTSLVLKEAEQIPEFAGRTIGCLVSLGTGLASLARPVGPSSNSVMESDAKAQRIMQSTLENARKLFNTPSEANDRLKQLRDDLVATATNTEATHHGLFWTLRERKPKITYVRFNPPGGLDTIDLADFTRGADIEAVTNQYLESPEVAKQIVDFAATIAPITANPLYNLEADFLPPKVLHNLKRDAKLNMLSNDAATGSAVTLPKFSKELTRSNLVVRLDSTTRFGSCAFELSERLGLLPHQPNKMLNEVETIPLGDLVHNGDTYCCRISRHFLVQLISEHVQEVWQVGDRTYVSTDIGRFTLYEHEGRSFVHFDGSSRTTATTTIPDQVLEDIRRIALGNYRSPGGTMSPFTPGIVVLLMTQFSHVVHYIRRRDIEEFRLLRDFADVLKDVACSIIQTVPSPQSFVVARARDWATCDPRTNKPPQPSDSSPAEFLVAYVQLADSMFGKRIENLRARDIGVQSAQLLLSEAITAHAAFRGAEIDRTTFITRSHGRFEELFDSHRGGRGSGFLREQLLALLANPRRENVALVTAQIGLALLVKCNAEAVLNLAKEAPEEWIRIVTAEDGDMFIGAAPS